MRKKTRYERVRDQHSRIWRKRNAQRMRRRLRWNRVTNAKPKFRSANVPDKQRSMLEQLVFLAIQKSKMLAMQHEQSAPAQIPQKVMQRRGA